MAYHDLGQSHADRQTIVEAGDYMNHAIFTKDEYDGGLSRLIAAGHVEEREGRYRPSDAALNAYETDSRKGESVWDVRKRVDSFLGLTHKSGRTR